MKQLRDAESSLERRRNAMQIVQEDDRNLRPQDLPRVNSHNLQHDVCGLARSRDKLWQQVTEVCRGC